MRLLPLILSVLVASASTRVRAEDADDIRWNGWLDGAEVWRLAEAPPVNEPAELAPAATSDALRPIEPASVPPLMRPPHDSMRSGRVVRYEAPLSDRAVHEAFASRGIRGELISVPVKAGADADSTIGKYSARVAAFFVGEEATPGPDEVMLVRYEAPVEDIALHTQFANLRGEIIEPGAMRLPEVRFFQPKARIYTDLKRDNDSEFDMFDDGALLASLDVVEFYFPMPLITERFARTFGRSNQLSGLGWRLGATVGLGITTALSNGDAASSAPISTLSTGIRYDFPLGRPSAEVLATGDWRLDERTRVGIEGGVQGGLSTDESLSDSTDVGLYLGILVNTPW